MTREPTTTAAAGRPGRRAHRRGFLATCLAFLLSVGAGLADTEVTTAAAATDTNATVSADALPTVQIDGVVWEQAVIGDIVYAVGDFSTARPAGAPAGQQTVRRTHILAYNMTTGLLVDSFAPTPNAKVMTVAASPDGSRLYIGGNFTQIDGVSATRLAAIDPATGAVDTAFRPVVNGRVDTVVANSSTVYFGGWFNAVGNQSRSRIASVDARSGALRNWAPVADNAVEALALSPDGSRIAVGGRFATLNGSSNPGLGMGLLSTADGSSMPWAVGSVVRNYKTGGISSLSTDGTAVYGSGWDAGAESNFEGAFSASWNDGSINWLEDCHGDSHSALPHMGVVYVAGHPHSCSGVRGFPETNPRTHHHSLAFSTETTGVLAAEPSSSGYTNFGGRPAPSLLNWFPDWSIGSYTGQNQGPWTIAANGKYLLYGGEFTRVNGVGQQGLVRFAMRDTAPNKRGPRLSGQNFPVTATSPEAGKVNLTWRANWDQDHDTLQYKVIRDGNTTTPVGTVEGKSRFYTQPNMAYQDGSVTEGEHTYQVVATDAAGNTAASAPVTVDVVGGTPPEEPEEPTDGSILIDDTFDRTGTGWASPGTGLTWSTSGGTGITFATENGHGVVSWTTAGKSGTATVTGLDAQTDTDMTGIAALDPAPTGNGGYWTLRSRLGAGDEYRATARVLNSGSVYASLGVSIDGNEQTVASVKVPNLTYAANDKISLRFSTTGTNPTTLRMKIWKTGTTEPTDWTLSTTNSTAELQRAGGVGVRYYISGSSTNGPGKLFLDRFTVRKPQT
ncbi:PKD domain-containing protein [Kocuria sp. CH-021]|uniref:PKD domain-containing protein n=1 Tax=Kocuria sp. CH-021 TaxID=3406735 RepID=UPI003C736D12